MKSKVLVLLLFLAVLAGCSRPAATRTDAQVASDVQNKIYSDAAVQSRQITVQAANGVVTLNGTVNTDAERAAAANDAGAIDGVKTVVNNLQTQQALVAPPPQAEPPAPQAPVAEKPSPRKSKTVAASAGKRNHRPRGYGDNDNSQQAMNTSPPAPITAPEVQAPAPVAPPPPPKPVKVTVPAGTQL